MTKLIKDLIEFNKLLKEILQMNGFEFLKKKKNSVVRNKTLLFL